jgi:chromosomal replication initiator protein
MAAAPHPEVAEVQALAPRAPRMRVIVERTAEAFGVRAVDLLRDRRRPKFTHPRHAAMALCRELTGHSLPRIGQAMGRDHTTVLNALHRHQERLADPAYAARITALRERLTQESTHHDT